MSLEHARQRRRRRPYRGRYPPLLVRVLDAADMLGMAVTRTYELIGTGLLDSVLIGRRRYVTRESLERLATRPQAAE
jgi:hypothetical protein